MANELRFVLIGCGRIANRHAEQIQRVGKLIAAYDILPEVASSFADKYHCRSYSDIQDLIKSEKKEADIAVICSPNGWHASQTIICLQNGWHVLCEKPMAIHSRDALKMIQVADELNKNLFIVQSYRFHAVTQFVKRLIDEDKLGKIVSFQLNCFWNRSVGYYQNSWKGSLEFDGGILYTQFSHFIDLLYWYFGEVKAAKGIKQNFMHKNIVAFEDTGMAILTYQNGMIGNIHYTINSFKKNMEGSLTIFGEKGTVKIGGEYCNKLEYLQVENEADINYEQEINNTARESLSHHDKIYDQVKNSLQSFVKDDLYTNANESCKTVEIIEMIYSKSEKLS
jgi:UDP-N-acetyl-2-amino-2-deoxyglucuronate dehydrogenase